ncbi:MAG TPA: type II toxin-antitoxin system Phd/YefM family antitoxin [Candidatus Baltobacteraceae bacterium]
MKRAPNVPSPSVGDSWNLQDAKARFSELVDLARMGTPQIILRRGVPAAAVISIEEFQSLARPNSLVSFLLHETPRGPALDIERSREEYVPRIDFDDEPA